MPILEKTGTFYLGNTGKNWDTHLLYESKDLTTHGVIVGMTGSGKTGLGIDLLEEAALDLIPALIIDPKGDLSDLLLTFPELRPEDFAPWIDPAEADRKKTTVDALAKETAETWKKGIEASGQSKQRIAQLKDSVERVIYTPASQAGIPISILSSFKAPPEEVIQNPDEFRDKIITTVSSLLGLLGIQADPIKSREHILLSTILETNWKEDKDLTLESLIAQIQKPKFTKIGVFDLNTFFPEKDRQAFSITLNNLLASPGFRGWLEGEPLDIQRLLYTKEGKPKHAILSIAHLQDAERMFFVTLFLNELISWMRKQSGTSSLRAILYMDEIFGFFPPNGMPPSKKPMLTLLKQARAYGLGVVLSTQNPVDLDYKGLSNCGTWFIGKLQTEQDIGRIITGLKSASLDDASSSKVQKLLEATGKRKFVIKNLHDSEPVLFETRFSMSYLSGPLTLPQISSLMKNLKGKSPTKQPQVSKPTEKPEAPIGIDEYFLDSPKSKNYQPLLIGFSKLHFVDSKNKIDLWRKTTLAVPTIDSGNKLGWDQQERLNEDSENELSKNPSTGTFQDLPSSLSQPKAFTEYKKTLADQLYQTQTLELFYAPDTKTLSQVDESEGDFRTRLTHVLREKRNADAEKIRQKYQPKIKTLEDRINRSELKYEKEKSSSFAKKIEAFLSFLATLLSSLLGRKKISSTTISKAGTSLRKVSRSMEDQNVTQAESSLGTYQQQLEDTKLEMEQEIAKAQNLDPDKITLDTITIRPRKSDIDIDNIGILWRAS